jgi:hypothetical protein
MKSPPLKGDKGGCEGIVNLSEVVSMEFAGLQQGAVEGIG